MTEIESFFLLPFFASKSNQSNCHFQVCNLKLIEEELEKGKSEEFIWKSTAT